MYIAHTNEEKKEMLEKIGITSMDELFSDIPDEVKLKREPDLPSGLSEPELLEYFIKLSEKNINFFQNICFLGAGTYNHFIPSVIPHLLSRAEFYTSYTPYQAEISQGMLQAIFEYQTLICQLTGMEVSNASHYNGATAVCEAAFMALSHTRRKKILVSSALHPDYRQILRTYFLGKEDCLLELPYTDGVTDIERLEISKDVAAVIVQTPNFFGSIEDMNAFAEKVHSGGALFIVAVLEPFSLGLLKSPGKCGADIVAGEGQSFGIPAGFGGPHLGFLACTENLMRKMAGRLVGLTVDSSGKRGFVLTLQTREQHIRRERATSNICSNQALCALAATIYLTYAGKSGFREVSNHSFQKARYGANKLSAIEGYKLTFNSPFYNEFLLTCPEDPAKINKFLSKHNITGGFPLGKYYPELKNNMLLCFTEQNKKKDIDYLASLLQEVK